MNDELEKKYRQFKIDFKTLSAEYKMVEYNELGLVLENVIDVFKKIKTNTHYDDDKTHEVLADIIDNVQTAVYRLEDIPIYDGYGNRY